MPITITCPNCNRALRVPDELLGKRVKCPSCATVLTASAEGSIEATSRPPQGGEVVRRKRPPEPEEEAPVVRRKRSPEPEEEEEEAPRPARRRPKPPSEEDYEEEEPEEEEEERPRRRRRRLIGSRQRARDAVAAPAIALMVVGGLGTALYLVTLILRLAGVEFLPFKPPNQGDGGFQQDIAFKAGGWAGNLVALSWGITVLSGAIQMKNLKSYGHAMTASIVSMLPCNICCLIGIPFGIWALIVINRSDVRPSFG